jgi:hypothetical protein
MTGKEGSRSKRHFERGRCDGIRGVRSPPYSASPPNPWGTSLTAAQATPIALRHCKGGILVLIGKGNLGFNTTNPDCFAMLAMTIIVSEVSLITNKKNPSSRWIFFMSLCNRH